MPKLRKPARWALTRGLTDPNWVWFWDHCLLAFPMWEGQGELLNVYGRLAGTLGGQNWDGSVPWEIKTTGTSLDFNKDAANRLDFNAGLGVTIPHPYTHFAGTEDLGGGTAGSIVGGLGNGIYAFTFFSADLFHRVPSGFKSVSAGTHGGVQEWVVTRASDGDSGGFFVNGTSLGTYTGLGTGEMILSTIGGHEDGTRPFDGNIRYYYILDFEVPDHLIVQLARDPYGPFRRFDDAALFALAGEFAPDFTAFRFYEDGTESGSTAAADQDTDVTRDINVAAELDLHLRTRIEEQSGGAGDTTDDWQLQYNLNGAGWNNVTAVSSAIRVDTVSDLADGVATTNRATGISDPTGVFVAGVQEEGDGAFLNHQITAGDFTEHVNALRIQAGDVFIGDTIDFRWVLTTSGAGTLTNTSVPRINIADGSVVLLSQARSVSRFVPGRIFGRVN